MFTPNSKVKKILAHYGSCAYVHSDGVVVKEQKEIKIQGGNTTSVTVWHIIPCEIHLRTRIYGKDYDWQNPPKTDRLVIHDCKLIVGGFDEVEILFNCMSDASNEKGLTINTVRFSKGDHRWQDVRIVGIWGSNVTVQPDPTDRFSSDGDNSIHNYLDYSWRSGNSVVVHGELPEKKIEVLQLTVAEN